MFKTNGKIILITGPMYAGKTRQLIFYFNKFNIENKKSIAFRPSFDSRTEKIESRNGTFIPTNNIEDPKDILTMSKSFDSIFIDEFHFFSEKIISIVKKLKSNGKTIVISGLDKDFLKKNFNIYESLKEVADLDIKMTAICITCRNIAKYSRRVEDDNTNSRPDSERLLVDDFKETRYFSSCANCHPEK